MFNNGAVMEEDTKSKIINITLKLLGNESINKISIRRIAMEAGVNVAAINYYFGSKENLVKQAFKTFGIKTREIFYLLQDKQMRPQLRLKKFLVKFSEHMTEYPGFTRSMIEQVLSGSPLPGPLLQNMKTGKENLLTVFKEMYPEIKTEDLVIHLFQVMAGLVYPVLFGNLINSIYGFDYNKTNTRKKYLEIDIQKAFSLKEVGHEYDSI